MKSRLSNIALVSLVGLAIALALTLHRIEWLRNTHPQESFTPAQSAAIAAAKLEISKRGNWSNGAVWEVSAGKHGWDVFATRIAGRNWLGNPQFQPGGHALIRVDKQGKVVAFVPGA